MPLPTDIRYTWITSDIAVDNGDGVVALSRQWIYDGAIPMPWDGVDYRLSDTLLTDVGHLSVDDELNTVVRALDESDYPFWAWEIELDNDQNYFGVPQLRSQDVPDGPNTSDPYWFTFFVPTNTTQNLCIEFTPNTDLSSSIDFFSSPGNYTSMAVSGDVSVTLPAGSGTTILTIPNADLNLGGNNYIRIIHDGLGPNDWRMPYKISPTLKSVVPIELSSFTAKVIREGVQLDWSTSAEINNRGFEILRSENNLLFSRIAEINGSGNTTETKKYVHLDTDPLVENFYQLRQIDFDGNSSLSNVIHISLKEERQHEIKIFPNPSVNILHIDLTEAVLLSDELVEIFTVEGKLVKQISLDGKNTVQVDVSGCIPGLYFIQLKTKTGTLKKLFAKT